MAVRDKLDRWRTESTAVSTERADIPFWITLTPRERRRWPANEQMRFYLAFAEKRRQFRAFVRGDVQ